MVLHLLKPFVYLWAGLNFIDDLSLLMKITRLLGEGIFRHRDQSPETTCDLCDEVMEDLLKGSETLDAVPCSWICLGAPKCTDMCETVQELSDKWGGEFPCVSAGYCAIEDDENTGFLNGVDCKKGPLFSCEPKKFCRKQRPKFGFKYTCDLKPGRGRWIHMKKTAHQHASAMAAGLLHQKRCGEPDAGPYCIAKPSGGGRVAEYLAWFLSILYGGYASTVAIESPGGDDDQQWLTFWVMFVASMFLEQTFARVLLSKFPFYYQVKLAFIVWLIFFDGAATVYRWLRMRISQWSPLLTGMLDNRKQSAARLKLNSMISIGGTLITDQIDLLEWELKRSFKKRNAILFSQSSETECFWEYDYTDTKRGMNQASLVAEEQLYQISKWLISSEGIQKMEDVLNSNKVAFLLERAVTVISFEPKLLSIHLISTTPGEGGKLPVMDQNGKADCYVKFALVSEREFSLQNCTEEQHVEGSYMNRTGMAKLRYLNQVVTSRTAYRTIEPEWNEILEMPIKGGMGEDGTYRNYDIKDTILIVEAWDADCEKWGIALEVFRFLGCVLIFVLVVAYVLGAIDFFFDEKLSAEQWWWKATIIASTLYVAVGMLLSWMMSVVLKADDDFIGISAVPLEILTDQRGHSLILKLRKLGAARGSLRVKLRLSEN